MAYAARAPGKLILSGEHSVVYGAPALVAAIARYTTVHFTPLHRSKSIRTIFKGLPKAPPYPLHALHKLKQTLDEHFEQFSRGQREVQHILNRPDDLLIYTLATFAQHIPLPGRTSSKHLPMPGRLRSESELPLGAGMGSSASAIAASIRLYEHLLDKPLTISERFERVRFCERLQHGKGSAIDAAAVTYGGLQYLENATPQPLAASLENNGHWYWILHGYPEASTGEVVAHVRHKHGDDHALWQQFATCSHALRQQLLANASPAECLNENQHLLEHIGVVPETAKALIMTINHHGGSAKISGAGAHRGNGGGIILAWHPEPNTIPELLTNHALPWGELHLAEQGATLIT